MDELHIKNIDNALATLRKALVESDTWGMRWNRGTTEIHNPYKSAVSHEPNKGQTFVIKINGGKKDEVIHLPPEDERTVALADNG